MPFFKPKYPHPPVPALNTAAIAPITTPLPPNSVAGEKCGLATNQSTSGTYSVGSNGRTVVKAADGTTRIFYVVSPTEAVLLSGEGNGYLGSLEQ
jgi:hypothetical protein